MVQHYFSCRAAASRDSRHTRRDWNVPLAGKPIPKGGNSMAGLVWGIVVVLFILWLLGGFVMHFGGNLIHLLVVIALVLLVYNLITGRGARI
jgi:hypothetical protein